MKSKGITMLGLKILQKKKKNDDKQKRKIDVTFDDRNLRPDKGL
jgi:hypothetical protein